MKTVYVVEYVARDDSEQGVAGVFSSWNKAIEYISSEVEDEEMIGALGNYEYVITKAIVDAEVVE